MTSPLSNALCTRDDDFYCELTNTVNAVNRRCKCDGSSYICTILIHRVEAVAVITYDLIALALVTHVDNG